MRSSARHVHQPAVLATVVALVGALALLLSPSAASAGPWWEPVNPQTPDSEVDVTGEPFTGTTGSGEVRGFIDAHTHMFSDLGFGGNVVCGATFSQNGIADALKDCPAHYPDGRFAIVENLASPKQGGNIFGTHDPVGWPTFTYWPDPDSFTHQQMYYKWVERAWRGGERIMVNDLVSNSGLCLITGILNPPNRYNCNDMDSIRREARAAHDLEAFIDARYGGPGKGWYRIVTSADQARGVIEQGKLAVVLGVETSEPFGCKLTLGHPDAACTKAAIDAGLDELQALGVSSMFLCHKFDNALCGVRYDEGTTGLIVNLGQFLTTGVWWNPQTCEPGQVPDHTVIGGVLPPELSVKFPQAVLPIYPKGPHCNPKGLTDLGEYALRGMMKRHMKVEIDHMSAKAAGAALSIMEAAGYPGAVSSHSWLADEYMERLYDIGGFATQYGHDATAFVAGWRQARPLLTRYGTGYGFGMDMNGFGGTPLPRGTASAPPADPVVYPFTSFDGGSVLDRQRTGQREWDVNTDGVAHYGQIPDWIEDMGHVAGADKAALIADLSRGAESYLQMWKAAQTWVAQPNLALGRPAAASSTQWSLLGSFLPPRANDADATGTRWASNWSDNQWWRVDLGTAQPVRRVSLRWENAYAASYAIQLSTDGSTWQTVWSTTTGRGGIITASFPTTNARYVRVAMTKRGTIFGYSLWDVGVYSH